MVLAVIYFQSPLSKISEIDVEGNQNVSNEVVIELSKLADGTSFWKINKEEIASNLLEHDEINDVTVLRKFPNKLVIEIKELNRVAYVIDGEGNFYPILENGKTLSKQDNSGDAPLLVNWQDDGDIVGLAKELNKLPESIASAISEIHYTPKESDRLHITLFMNNGFEVSITVRGLAEKMKAYPTVINELDPSLKGVIHLDVVPFFESYKHENETENEGEDLNETEG